MAQRVRRQLLAACSTHAIAGPGEHTVPEPYIPHIPDGWNGRIVLAEAQNHGKTSSVYVAWLKARGPRGRMRRLDFWTDGVGIQPWDDGTLKLAVEAAFGLPAEQWAVSNAVLWSRVGRGGRNGRPSEPLIRRSIGVWVDFLRTLRPTHIVTAGKVAGRVIGESLRQCGITSRHSAWLSSSPTYLCHLSPRFDQEDLLRRFPAAEQAVMQHPEWVAGQNREHKVFYACHAMSVVAGARLEAAGSDPRPGT